MWNILPGNRLTAKRRKQQAHQKHISALNNIKSMVNNKAPPQYSFLYSRPKTRQLQYERKKDIQYDNNVLLSKMMKSGSYIDQKNQNFLKESLNATYKNKVGKEIDDGNYKMVRRLESAKSAYTKNPRSIEKYSRYRSNMAFTRMDPIYALTSSPTPYIKLFGGRQRPFSAKR